MANLEMTSTSPQYPRDRILWILAGSGERMEWSKFRRAPGLKKALLNPIFDELMKEGRIGISGEIIFLAGRWILLPYVTLIKR